jgi:hypothetical protein
LIISSGYPNGTVCNYYIKRYDHHVTQLRLEFIQVQLAPPTGDGLCTRDYISVESDSLNVPRLCGTLTGQHVYVHLPKHKKFWLRRTKSRKLLGLNIKIAASSSFFQIRRWKIRVIQIRKHKRRFPRGILFRRKEEQTIYKGLIRGGSIYKWCFKIFQKFCLKKLKKFRETFWKVIKKIF